MVVASAQRPAAGRAIRLLGEPAMAAPGRAAESVGRPGFARHRCPRPLGFGLPDRPDSPALAGPPEWDRPANARAAERNWRIAAVAVGPPVPQLGVFVTRRRAGAADLGLPGSPPATALQKRTAHRARGAHPPKSQVQPSLHMEADNRHCVRGPASSGRRCQSRSTVSAKRSRLFSGSPTYKDIGQPTNVVASADLTWDH
jgi:hypothetical protein